MATRVRNLSFEQARAELAKTIYWRVDDDRIVDAFAAVPREEFVPAYSIDATYHDSALPIGEGQTISQPTMIAIMLAAARLQPTDNVLDVGTGSGYQAALLSHLVDNVVGVERVPSLVERSSATLQRLGYANVVVHQAHEDVLGWPDGAPYDAIVVAASSPRVPDSLVEQLASGGRLVIPVGSTRAQELIRVTKTGSDVRTESLGGCVFVPLIGRQAWSA